MKVFISYSHRDAKELERLLVHLKPLVREENIKAWCDKQISPSDDWKEKISESLNSANVAILLVSADFLASDFISNDELPVVLEKREKSEMVILTVILSDCLFMQNKRLSRYQSVNDPRKPIRSLKRSEKETVWANVAREIFKFSQAKEEKEQEAVTPAEENMTMLFTDANLIWNAPVIKLGKEVGSELSISFMNAPDGKVYPVHFNGATYSLGSACLGDPKKMEYDPLGRVWKTKPPGPFDKGF